MSKVFINPTQKGVDLFPDGTRLPIKLIIPGTEHDPALRAQVIADFSGYLTSFQRKQTQLSSLSPGTWYKQSLTLPEGRMTYTNNLGMETLQLDVHPSKLTRGGELADFVDFEFDFDWGAVSTGGKYPYVAVYVRGLPQDASNLASRRLPRGVAFTEPSWVLAAPSHLSLVLLSATRARGYLDLTQFGPAPAVTLEVWVGHGSNEQFLEGFASSPYKATAARETTLDGALTRWASPTYSPETILAQFPEFAGLRFSASGSGVNPTTPGGSAAYWVAGPLGAPFNYATNTWVDGGSEYEAVGVLSTYSPLDVTEYWPWGTIKSYRKRGFYANSVVGSSGPPALPPSAPNWQRLAFIPVGGFVDTTDPAITAAYGSRFFVEDYMDVYLGVYRTNSRGASATMSVRALAHKGAAAIPPNRPLPQLRAGVTVLSWQQLDRDVSTESVADHFDLNFIGLLTVDRKTSSVGFSI